MAVDEALLNCFKEGDMPIFRLYGWERALSLGKFSDPLKTLDMARLEEEKIPCTRRMTGGGVLVHGEDLSYSLILPHGFLKERGVKASYRYLCAFLVTLYKKLGHEASFSCDLEMELHRSDICLAGKEAYDIVIEGKKIGGNAQRHTRHALLQHGSIPIKKYPLGLKALFLTDSGLQSAATLEGLGTILCYEELAGLVRESFCESFDVTLIADNLLLREEEDAKQLLADKYSVRSWNINADQTSMKARMAV